MRGRWILLLIAIVALVAGVRSLLPVETAPPTWTLDPGDYVWGSDAGNGVAVLFCSGGDTANGPWRLWRLDMRARKLAPLHISGHGYPWVIADPKTGRAFAGDTAGAPIQVLDGPTGRVIRRERSDPFTSPPTLDVVRHRLFAPRGSGAIAILDTRDGRRLATYRVPSGPYSVAVAIHAGRLFVSSGASQLWTLDARSGALLRTFTGAGTAALVAVEEHTGRVFVSSTGDSSNGTANRGSVAMLDARSGALLRSVAIPAGWGLSAPVVDEQTDRVFASSGNQCLSGPACATRMLVLDARTERLLYTATVATSGPPLLDARDGRVFMTSVEGGILSILDARNGHLLRTVALGSGLGDAFLDEPHHRLLVTVRDRIDEPVGPGHLTVLDTRSGALLRTVDAGWNPAVMAVDSVSGRVLVVEAGLHLPPGIPAVSLADRWSWLPNWLRRRLPFIPAPPRVRFIPAKVTVLDNLLR